MLSIVGSSLLIAFLWVSYFFVCSALSFIRFWIYNYFSKILRIRFAQQRAQICWDTKEINYWAIKLITCKFAEQLQASYLATELLSWKTAELLSYWAAKLLSYWASQLLQDWYAELLNKNIDHKRFFFIWRLIISKMSFWAINDIFNCQSPIFDSRLIFLWKSGSRKSWFLQP